MSIVFHKRGLIIYCIALALSIVFASFFGGPVSFVWLYAMLLLVPISFLYIFINYKFLSLYQEIELHKVTKGDTHNWTDAEVIIWGNRYRTFGYPITGEQANIPLRWGQNVRVERYG